MEEASDLETDAGLAPVPPLGVVPEGFRRQYLHCSSFRTVFACCVPPPQYHRYIPQLLGQEYITRLRFHSL